MKKKILICGGTGFLGRNIATRFAQDSAYEVHAIHHSGMGWYHDSIIWHKADLREDEQVMRVVKGMDIVIQAAAKTSGCKDTFEQPWVHVTENAIMNALIFRAAHLNEVEQLVFFSCSTMYGDGFNQEETPIDPADKYFGMVETKLYNEKMCQFYASLGKTNFTVVRGSNFYGPGDKYSLDRAHVFGATVTKVMQAAESISVWGDGTEKRDVCYIDDLVDFVQAALNKQKDSFRIYNCGYEVAFPVSQIVNTIIEASGKQIKVDFDTSKPSIKVSVALDCSRARRELGWRPKTSLFEGAKKTLEWYKQAA
jgi:GDP-L-fucose synthase